MTTARTTSAAAVPASVERQPRVMPIARTIVNASTNSTADGEHDGDEETELARIHADIIAQFATPYRETGPVADRPNWIRTLIQDPRSIRR